MPLVCRDLDRVLETVSIIIISLIKSFIVL